MAGKKTNVKIKSKNAQVIVIFWLIFIIIIISIFMVKFPVIEKNFKLFKTRITAASNAEEEILPLDEEEPAVTVTVQQQPARPAPQTQTQTTEPAKPGAPEPAKPAAQTTQPAAPAPKTSTQTQPAAQTTPPVQTRDRSIYYTQVNNDGQILHSKVTRRVPVSDSPMQDSLNVLLKGPTAEELSKGIVNLIPQNTRVLSATVRGSTAYISFSEDFLFNTFGVEGYVASLRQIVWTVTEFQNVKDVQILIEGRRMDYLGEGIWIGSPINRQSF